GFRMPLPAGEPDSLGGARGGCGGVSLNQVERRLRELKRVVFSDRDCHSSRCIKAFTACSECS
ncbi:MAG TPA: hypothetical protein VMA96_14220, partial [Solirubrobacteraceae bacterium]|nr:hypothetical protein [Solirubrobacteraceae bacterium]